MPDEPFFKLSIQFYSMLDASFPVAGARSYPLDTSVPPRPLPRPELGCSIIAVRGQFFTSILNNPISPPVHHLGSAVNYDHAMMHILVSACCSLCPLFRILQFLKSINQTARASMTAFAALYSAALKTPMCLLFKAIRWYLLFMCAFRRFLRRRAWLHLCTH